MEAAKLLKLADACEKASSPDRELDAMIYDLTPDAIDYQRISLRLTDVSRLDRYHDGWVTVYGSKGQADPYPEDLSRYTASLDAALTLVSRYGVLLHLSDIGADGLPLCNIGDSETGREFKGVGTANLALAVCAAALRTRAAQVPHV